MYAKNNIIKSRAAIRPVSKLNSSALAAMMLDSDDQNDEESTDQNLIDNTSMPIINLFDFSRIYKIGQFPIIDFIVVYIFLYMLNLLCYKYNYKLLLTLTIPLVIIINLLLNQGIKFTPSIGIVLFLTIFYLIYDKIHINKN